MAPPSQARHPQDVSAAQKERNEYIPSFISKKPFYVADEDTSEADYLEHQRLQKQNEESQQKWYDRGRKVGPAATKFRKGACENCGAMTHKTKDCLSRPRKQGAKWTGKDIQADEVIQDVKLGWDAKRDRWNGYDSTEYRHVVEEFNALEELKKQGKAETEDQDGNLIGSEDDDEGAKYEEETDMGRQQSTSTRNLRIREDTAKYLLNLDLDSAKYDPKTRSMVDSGATADQSAALVAEEGFMKASGDAAEFDKAQRYAWEMQERGDKHKIHLQANPTSGEYFRRKQQEENDAKRAAEKKALLERYGSQDQVQKKQAKDSEVVESERFVEYDEKGGIKGLPKIRAKSQYNEDVFINNHTSVWGSWWKDFQWGYACCHSVVKNSYCTGEEGKRALEETDRLRTLEALEVPKEIAWAEESSEQTHVPNDVDDAGKVKMDVEARKRKLQDIKNDGGSDELEAYRRKRIASGDPMVHHLGLDELIS